MNYNIYFIQDFYGNIKIGYSSNVIERLSSFQTAHAAPLKLLATINKNLNEQEAQNLEKDLHNEFSKFRKLGEWFSSCREIFKKIEEIATEFPNEEIKIPKSTEYNIQILDFKLKKIKIPTSSIQQNLPFNNFKKSEIKIPKSNYNNDNNEENK